MVPQMHMIAYNTQLRLTSAASHFVGLLCLGRVLRMAFWGVLLFVQYMNDHHNAHYIWTFIVPDLVHTVIMGDFLYLWFKKVKRDHLDNFDLNSFAGSMSV